jgi:transcriptional regulator with XRE-family HTH domain
MSRRRTLKDLYERIGPVEAAKAKALAQQKMETILLSQFRKQLGLTQAAVAKAMGVSQSALSQLESQDDMQLSTLRRVVQAMGGEVAVVLRFDDREVVLESRRRGRSRNGRRSKRVA